MTKTSSTMAKREFIIEVNEQGRIPDNIRQAIADLIAKVPGRKIRLTIALYKRMRSLNQSNFYFGFIVPPMMEAMNAYGNAMDEDETHEFIKEEIWKHTKIITRPDGTKKKITRSSTELTAPEWEEKMELTRAWAAFELGLILKYPNEY